MSIISRRFLVAACLGAFVAAGIADVQAQQASRAKNISGRVFHDGNRNGKFDPDEEVFADVLISDGAGFAKTNAQGCYELQAREGRQFVAMHKPAYLDVERFYRVISSSNPSHDFHVTKVEPKKTVRFLAVGDQETSSFDWLTPIKKYAETQKNVDFFVLCGDISSNGPGLAEHAKHVTRAAMGMPVYACIGNHDILPAGSKLPSYADALGPWWYSFEYADVLFVVAPMYHCFSPPLPYKMEDFGAWLTKLMAQFPRSKKKVMISHDLLNRNQMVVDCGPTRIDLAQHHFIAYVYGHKHMNAMRRYSNGIETFTMAPPNKGGCGQFAPSYEDFTISEDGKVSAALRYVGLNKWLHIASPANDMLSYAPRGELTVSVVAYDSALPVKAVEAQLADSSGKILDVVALSRVGDFSWQAAVKPSGAAPGTNCKIMAKAEFLDGTTKRAVGEFALAAPRPPAPAPTDHWPGFPGATIDSPALRPGAEIKDLKLAWIVSLGGTTALAGPIVADGKVFVAVCDDAMSRDGGVHALDAATGRKLWVYRSGYSIRNTIVWHDGRILAIDANANIHAIDSQTGSRAWINPGLETEINPSASGLVVLDETVVAGYGAQLRGCDIHTGQTLWRNKAWVERTPGTDSLSAFDGKALVISQLNGLFAHDAKTGAVQFRFNKGFLSGTAVPAGDRIFVKGADMLFCLDANGKMLHEKKLGRANTALSPVVIDGKVFAGTDFDLRALDGDNFNELWKFKPNRAILDTTTYALGAHSIEGTPVARGKTLWFGASDGCLYGLDIDTGNVRRKIELGFSITSSVAMVGDWLYVVDMAARVFGFRTD